MKGYTTYKSYMCVLEWFLMGDFLVGDPPPVIFFGTFSTSWKLESTVRNRLFGRRLFFLFLIFI